MDSEKTQDDINQEEFQNPNNWSGIWPWKVYFSKRDSRLWVTAILRKGPLSPHVNLGHRWAMLVLSLIFYGWLVMAAWILWPLCHR